MSLALRVGDAFPDLVLPDQTGEPVRLGDLVRPSRFDEYAGFGDGYPLIVQFYRGYFCPRDRAQFRDYVAFQRELAVNYATLVAIGVDPPRVHAAFRAGLGATWPFLADESRDAVRRLGILDETEGEFAYRALPYTFVLDGKLRIEKIYDGWFYVGRPTLHELHADLRAIMSRNVNHRYDAWTTEAVTRVRIPQQAWAGGAPELGATGLPVHDGVVRTFDAEAGSGTIAIDGGGEAFFNFTAIPGEGYRTLGTGTRIRFETVETPRGLVASNVREQR